MWSAATNQVESITDSSRVKVRAKKNCINSKIHLCPEFCETLPLLFYRENTVRKFSEAFALIKVMVAVLCPAALYFTYYDIRQIKTFNPKKN